MAKMRIKNPSLVQSYIGYKGMTMFQFAKQVSVSYARLTTILNGNDTTKPTTAKKIADALDVKIEDIFFVPSVRKKETI